MTRSISFKRDYHMMMPSSLFPTKEPNRADTFARECADNACEEKRLPIDVQSIEVESSEGLFVDIETPHELRFSTEGSVECKKAGDRFECSLGSPKKGGKTPSGEFVSSFDAEEVELNNFAVMHPWQAFIYSNINEMAPLALMWHPLLVPLGIGAYFLTFPFQAVGPATVVSVLSENAKNHWFLNGLEEEVHEVHIAPEKTKRVEIDERNPFVASARIKFDKKTKCEVWAEPSGINERRKLYCL